MGSPSRTIYAPPATGGNVDNTTDQTIAGEKTFTDRLAAEGDAQLGPDTNNLLVGALGDTSGAWIDAVLGSSNPNVSVHVRAKGPSGVIALESPTTVDDLTVAGAPAVTTTGTQTLTNKTLTSPAIGGTPTGLTKSHVGLNNVDNTADSAKPVSTAQQTALDAKQPLDSDLTAIAAIAPSNDDVIQRKSGVWVARSMAQVKTDLALSKSDVGLNNVDNTADSAKPVSTAQAAADALKLSIASNLSDLNNAGTARTNLGLGTAATLAAGSASGAATLDSNTKLTRAQLPTIGTIRNDLQSAAYWVMPPVGSTQSGSMTANRAYALPFILAANATLGDLGIDCTAVATGGNVRAGVYGSTSGLPGARLSDLGQVAAPTGGVAMMWWSPTDVLTAGILYYAVVVGQGLTGSPTFRQRNTNTPELPIGTARPSSLSGSLCAYYSDTGFSGALPDPFGAVAGVIAGPCIVIKA